MSNIPDPPLTAEEWAELSATAATDAYLKGWRDGYRAALHAVTTEQLTLC